MSDTPFSKERRLLWWVAGNNFLSKDWTMTIIVVVYIAIPSIGSFLSQMSGRIVHRGIIGMDRVVCVIRISIRIVTAVGLVGLMRSRIIIMIVVVVVR